MFFLAEESGNSMKDRERERARRFKGLFVSKIKSHCLTESGFDGAGIIGLITVQEVYLEEETGRSSIAREVDKSSHGMHELRLSCLARVHYTLYNHIKFFIQRSKLKYICTHFG